MITKVIKQTYWTLQQACYQKYVKSINLLNMWIEYLVWLVSPSKHLAKTDDLRSLPDICA